MAWAVLPIPKPAVYTAYLQSAVMVQSLAMSKGIGLGTKELQHLDAQPARVIRGWEPLMLG